MKKNIFKHVLMLVTALVLTCAAASCNSFGSTEYAVISQNNISADGFVYDKYENSTVRITGMESTPAVLVIPDKIDGMTVVEIADRAFAENDKIFYVEFPATAIKLGAQTFSGCPALLTVDFSNAVTVIPENKLSEATAALAVLGYSQGEIGVALKGIDLDSLTLEQIIKEALKKMMKG